MNTMNLAAAIITVAAAILCFIDNRPEASVLLVLLSLVNLVVYFVCR